MLSRDSDKIDTDVSNALNSIIFSIKHENSRRFHKSVRLESSPQCFGTLATVNMTVEKIFKVISEKN